MHVAKPQTVTDERKADEAHHEDVLPEENSLQPPNEELEEAKEEAPTLPEKEVEAPQQTTEESSTLDPKEDVSEEPVVDDTTTLVHKEEIPTQNSEEDEHEAKPKEDAPMQEPIDHVSAPSVTQSDSPAEEVEVEVDGTPATVEENAVAV